MCMCALPRPLCPSAHRMWCVKGGGKEVIKTAKKSGLKVTDCKPMSFSEDFAHFSNAVPGCFFLFGNGIDGANNKPLHSSDYDFNDDALEIGSTFWINLVEQQLPQRNS